MANPNFERFKLGSNQFQNENQEGTYLNNSYQNLNAVSAVFSNEGFLAELNNKKT